MSDKQKQKEVELSKKRQEKADQKAKEDAAAKSARDAVIGSNIQPEKRSMSTPSTPRPVSRPVQGPDDLSKSPKKEKPSSLDYSHAEPALSKRDQDKLDAELSRHLRNLAIKDKERARKIIFPEPEPEMDKWQIIEPVEIPVEQKPIHPGPIGPPKSKIPKPSQKILTHQDVIQKAEPVFISRTSPMPRPNFRPTFSDNGFDAMRQAPKPEMNFTPETQDRNQEVMTGPPGFGPGTNHSGLVSPIGTPRPNETKDISSKIAPIAPPSNRNSDHNKPVLAVQPMKPVQQNDMMSNMPPEMIGFNSNPPSCLPFREPPVSFGKRSRKVLNCFVRSLFFSVAPP
jgi:hypothetical protein